ncbi:MAG TPA: hypothetical protein VEH10_02745 [Thermoplasmata archaeon]|nr:hypothetical protein [Thermoplasmata archaeon]
MASPPVPGKRGGPGDERELTPEEEAAYVAGLERIELEKQRALADPGPSWREWFFYDHAKWWVGLGFLVVDVWAVGSWFTDGNDTPTRALGAVLTLAAVLYPEVLLYRYLWRRPSENESWSTGPFRPSWKALREFGRWTPEADRLRARGRSPTPTDGVPHPEEFL